MISSKLIEVITTLPDSACSIVTSAKGVAHVVNSWNSYIQIVDNKFLIPVGRMHKTEENLKENSTLLLTVSNRGLQGLSYKGTGFLVKGKGSFAYSGKEFDTVKSRYSWARAALVIELLSEEQTL